jgi:hypothetical protein
MNYINLVESKYKRAISEKEDKINIGTYNQDHFRNDVIA